MLDFTAFRNRTQTLEEVTYGLTRSDLARLTDEMVDVILEMIAICRDEDVVFEPSDPQAYDSAAATSEEVQMPWTLGHVIVHITASAEESAALAAELARGVPNHGRSRYEVPWTQITTVAQCRQRLEESRRMRKASLDMWPEQPHLGLSYKPYEESPTLNAVTRYVYGLVHEDDHLGQIAEIVRQAREARSAGQHQAL